MRLLPGKVALTILVLVLLGLTAASLLRGSGHEAPSRLTLARPAPAYGAGAPGSERRPVVVRVGPGTAGRSRLRVGITHTQVSLEPDDDPAALARARAALRPVAALQNQHLYGWGARNPEPAPGVFDWRSLDRRVEVMRRLGTTPVITLCCAPDWMTRLGTPTSRYPLLPPTEGHVKDFADLAARVARRYPDVRRFVVWNEMKGLWDPHAHAWDVRRYTRLYNAVHDALKAVDPRILVGGPYLNIRGTGSRSLGRHGRQTADPLLKADRAVLRSWLDHDHGADFVAIDRNVTPTHDPNHYSRFEQLQLARWFGEIGREVRAMTRLPVWWTEGHMDPEPGAGFRAAATATMLLEQIRGGAAASLLWGPQAVAGRSDRANAFSLVSDPSRPDGGRPEPALRAGRLVARTFPPGTPLRPVRASAPLVEVLASARATMLVNLRSRTTWVRVGRQALQLAPYAVSVTKSSHP